MLNRLKDKEEKIFQAIELLRLKSSKGVTIIVEGKKDEQALRKLGVEGKIVTVKTGGKSFFDIVVLLQEAGVSDVILMLDFDRRGKEGTKRLKQSLERVKITPHLEIWRELSGLIYRDVECVESIPNYLKTLSLKQQKQKPAKS